ncbi:ABC transporter permease [Bacillus sp. FJAT-45066]|uniref:ABC transporter permease n=1 Tax=Bacillus sp. FJAT-45066 TaxID=2011010 RepID=UPI000BB740C4|nr:ABC transporter permease [Bacillus sp. FJAT-45066]
MFNVDQFWKTRFVQYVDDNRRYLRYMFNDHLVIVMIFLLSGLALAYQNWLEVVPPTFPYEWLMGIVLALLLTRGSIHTLLKEPDLVFLLPLEEKLKPYIKKSFNASVVLESYFLLIIFGISVPLFLKVTETTMQSVLIVFVLLILLKIWNLSMKWHLDFYTNKKSHYVDLLVRLALNFAFLFLLFSKAYLYAVAIAVIMMGYFLYFRQSTKKMNWKWDNLIQNEISRMQLFYRVANLFVDVPGLKDKVKRRKWLDFMLGNIRFQKESTFTYLYARTFLRSGDYFGLYVRLFVIGAVLLITLPEGYATYFVPLFVLYLTGFQLVPLWRHHYNKLWLTIYPIDPTVQKKSFLKLLLTVLIVQTLLLAIIVAVTSTIVNMLVVLAIGAAFSYVFVHFSANKRISTII